MSLPGKLQSRYADSTAPVIDFVDCGIHGKQERTFVCQHIVQTLRDRQRRGFYWGAAEPGTTRGNAWCGECDKMLEAAGTNWTEELEKVAKISILCGGCYDEAKRLNGFS